MTSPLQLIRGFRDRSGTAAFSGIARTGVADDQEKLIKGIVAINHLAGSLGRLVFSPDDLRRPDQHHGHHQGHGDLPNPADRHGVAR